MHAYGERFRVYPLLNHGDADGECLAIEMAVLRPLSIDPTLVATVATATHQNCGNLVQDVNCLLGSCLLLGPIVGWHLGWDDDFC